MIVQHPVAHCVEFVPPFFIFLKNSLNPVRAYQRISDELSPYLNKLLSHLSERVNKSLPFSFYGNSVEVTTRQIELAGQPIMVRVLRLGRLGLFFLTLDHKIAGLYDPAADSWKPLPAEYGEEIPKAIQIGSKQRSMELLSLPLGRIVPQ